jgi:hypothetical protein
VWNVQLLAFVPKLAGGVLCTTARYAGSTNPAVVTVEPWRRNVTVPLISANTLGTSAIPSGWPG